MNLTLLWCWKEWRAQRGLLSAYLLLVFASLCCVFLMVSDQFWERTGGAHVLGWFVTVAEIGVVAFATPQLVRGEFGTKEDTFVRRLPGALLPAFRGKLLFLVLTACALPVLGLALGELFLTATGHSWNDLFSDKGNAYVEVEVLWPEIATWAAWAMVFVPWIWALGTWLPGGRMAIGGTALLALLLGLGVFAVLRRCEGLAGTLAASWQPWAYAAVPFGVLVAALSWIRGRRGGSNHRSARFGLSVFGLCLIVPAGWLGSWAYEYHHPDLERTEFLIVTGLSPDLRHAVGYATEDLRWNPVPVRIDLGTGASEQLGGIFTNVDRQLLGPSLSGVIARQRYWHVAGVAHEVLDMATGERVPIGYDREKYRPVLPAGLRVAVEADVRETPLLRMADGARVTLVGNELLFTAPDGVVRRETLPLQARSVRPAGHGVTAFVGDQRCLYDLTRMQVVVPPGLHDQGGYAVRGIWLLHRDAGDGGDGHWRRFDPDSNSVEICQELGGCGVMGLFDNDRVLCQRPPKRNVRKEGARTEWTAPELFLYRPADRTVTPLPLPQGLGTGYWCFSLAGSLVQESPALQGRLQVECRSSSWNTVKACLMRIDRTNLDIDLKWLPTEERDHETLAMTDNGATLLLVGHKEVVRVEQAGTRTVLFPRRGSGVRP